MNNIYIKKLKKKKNFYIIIFGLFIVSLIFIGKAFYNAIILETYSSKDFAGIYELSKDFWNKIDIFKRYFISNKEYFLENDLFFSIPTWSHLTYIIFLPYTLVPIKISKILWFFSNLIFLFFIIKLTKKYYNLSLNQSLILTLITISSTPLTNTLGNGQLSLFLLLVLIIYWYSKKVSKKFILSLSVIKISFGALFIFHSLLKKKLDFVYALIINVITVLFYSFYVNDFNFYQFINPLLVIFDFGKIYNFSGISNLNSIFIAYDLKNYYFLILLICFILIGIFLIKKKNEISFLSLIILTLILFYHNIYDFVLLIPLAAYAMNKKLNKIIKFFIATTIVYFFYFIKINEVILENYLEKNTIDIIGVFLLLICLFFLNSKKSQI